jgi:hypothetical protein
MIDNKLGEAIADAIVKLTRESDPVTFAETARDLLPLHDTDALPF